MVNEQKHDYKKHSVLSNSTVSDNGHKFIISDLSKFNSSMLSNAPKDDPRELQHDADLIKRDPYGFNYNKVPTNTMYIMRKQNKQIIFDITDSGTFFIDNSFIRRIKKSSGQYIPRYMRHTYLAMNKGYNMQHLNGVRFNTYTGVTIKNIGSLFL